MKPKTSAFKVALRDGKCCAKASWMMATCPPDAWQRSGCKDLAALCSSGAASADRSSTLLRTWSRSCVSNFGSPPFLLSGAILEVQARSRPRRTSRRKASAPTYVAGLPTLTWAMGTSGCEKFYCMPFWLIMQGCEHFIATKVRLSNPQTSRARSRMPDETFNLGEHERYLKMTRECLLSLGSWQGLSSVRPKRMAFLLSRRPQRRDLVIRENVKILSESLAALFCPTEDAPATNWCKVQLEEFCVCGTEVPLLNTNACVAASSGPSSDCLLAGDP